MKQLINASEMKQGDVISFYGSEFTLGEVYSRYVGTNEEVYWSKGICTNPQKDMINDPYFFNAITGEYAWQFQGNSNAKLTKIEKNKYGVKMFTGECAMFMLNI
jgi:hypothetical protein